MFILITNPSFSMSICVRRIKPVTLCNIVDGYGMRVRIVYILETLRLIDLNVLTLKKKNR